MGDRRVLAVRQQLSRILAITVLGGLLSCAGGPVTTGETTREGAFTLRVLPETFGLGGSSDFTLKVSEESKLTRVDVLATDAQGLKAAYLELEYDPAHFSVVGSQATGLLAQDSAAQLIQLQITATPGIATSGQLLARPQDQAGFSGSGALQTFWFASEPAPRSVSAPPQTSFSVTQLAFEGKTLHWHFSSQGDYDQNGVVNISDMTPLGIHYTEKVAPALFPYEDVQSVIDGDSNGEIFISDVTPVGVNFGNTITGYRVYGSASLDDYPPTNNADETVAPLVTVAVLDGEGSVNDRRRYEYEVAGAIDGWHYWVRPTDGSASGTPSNSVEYVLANLSPVADLQADVTTGAEPLLVTFDASSSFDSDGTIARYEFDWDGAGGHDYVDNGSNPLASHTFTGGISNVFLRVTDNLGATGTDTITVNAIQLSAPPTAVLNADVQSGPAPLTVTFDAGFSSDDVGIVKYEWDYDNNGTVDFDSGLISNSVRTYLVGGSITAKVIVTDADGQTASDTIDISVTGGTGEPVAVLNADVLLGPGPLKVTLDGSGSFDSDGGTIVNYEFDWEGDGLFEYSGANPTIDHDFDIGIWSPKLRVTDNDSKTAVAQVMLRVFDPLDLGPHAIVYADVRYGQAPLVVNFDASESFSTNGDIARYEWDWDGNGTFEQDSGIDSTVQHTFGSAGAVDIQLRVTDSLSATSSAKLLILPTLNDSFPPNDSIFILPCQGTASDGERVQCELYCRNTADKFQNVIGRIKLPSGNVYLSDSWAAGDIRGSRQSIDGVWTQMTPPPTGFLALAFPDDPGGGEMLLDLAVAPLDASDIVGASGAICNFAIEVHTDIDFEIVRADPTDRTYYQGSDLANRFWSDDDNSGLPGINLLP